MKKGFTLIELLAVIVILAIILAIAIPRITGIVESSADNVYDINKKMMKKAAVNYIGAGNATVGIDETVVVPLADLISNHYMNPIYDPQDEETACDGYVLVKIVNGSYQYKPFLQCGTNYEDDNYGTTSFDTTSPVITMVGSTPLTVYKGSTYTDDGATAQDDIDGDITADILVSGSVDTSTLGTYTLTYTVSDAAGNEADPLIRTVYVVDPPLAVVIQPHLTAKNDSNYYVGPDPSNWVEFAQVSSSNDTPIMWRIVKSDDEGIKIIYEGAKNGTSAPTQNGRTGSAAWDSTGSKEWERPASIRTTLSNWLNNLYDQNKNGYIMPVTWCKGMMSDNVYYDNNVPVYSALECTLQRTTAESAIGLLRASDYLSANSSGNFLYKMEYPYWTINAVSNVNGKAFITFNPGTVNDSFVTSSSFGVRPVINLKNNVLYNGGTGTLADPYKIVPDERPAITITGNEIVTVGVGDSYVDAGATAIDDIDVDITDDITVNSTVNPNVVGEYTVTYNVTDTSGNLASPAIRTVNVVEPTIATKIESSLVDKNGSKYFAGSNPNNWIEFGQVSSGDTTPIMWRIIKSDNEGIKIIYEGAKNGTSAPTQNGTLGIVNWDNYGSYGKNLWERPAHMKTYLNTWYNNLYVVDKTNYVQPMQWCISGPEQDSTLVSGAIPPSYFAALACVSRTASGGTYEGITADSTPIGMIQALDYMSTSTHASCTGSSITSCGTDNFLKKSYYYWTINAAPSNTYYVWTVHSNGSITHNPANYGLGQVRPVINLKTNIPYIGGDGTLTDPYRIQ